MPHKIVTLLLLSTVIKYGATVKCYHCYDLYNGTGPTFAGSTLGNKFIKCDKKQADWNSWNCPPDWPVCMVMSLTGKTHHEVVRTCAIKDFCSLYNAPDGVKLESCRECTTPLCNDYTGFPVPPENSGPSFVFNINLFVNKHSLKGYKDES